MNWNWKTTFEFWNWILECLKFIQNWYSEAATESVDSYRLEDILALQEIGQKDSGIRDTGNFAIFKSASTGKNTRGTEFMIRK